MITLKRTNSEDTDFIALVQELDKDLAIRDGADHGFYAQFNKIDAIKYALVAYRDDRAVGCGAVKTYENEGMEVKRMYVLPDQRGQGIAALVLTELEKWAKELQCKKCILETGLKQPEAIKLYQKCGYSIIPNYGQYKDVENSVCYEKWL